MTALYCLVSGQWRSLIVDQIYTVVLLDSTSKEHLTLALNYKHIAVDGRRSKMERIYGCFELVIIMLNRLFNDLEEE